MSAPVALVTGAATGIGRATAIAFAKVGYRVGIGHLNQDTEASELAEELGGLAFSADVSDPSAVAGMVAAAEATLGPIAVAVNCAGFDHDVTIDEIDDAMWDRAMHVLLGGNVHMIAAVAPGMKERGAGSIVTIASELAIIGESNHADYVTAKAAILGLTRCMAHELAPFGIRVNSVAPGPIDTALLGDRYREEPYLSSIPLGRLGRADEMATCIVGVAESTYMIGQIVSPNGGMVIQ